MGIDWLEHHHAILDYHRKKVIFHILGRYVFSYRCPFYKKSKMLMLISTMKTTRMMGNQCDVYLACLSIEDDVGVKKSMDEVDVVCEYLDMFPEDFLGLLPARDIDFVIDIVPRVAPISITSYRMAHAELRKLKK